MSVLTNAVFEKDIREFMLGSAIVNNQLRLQLQASIFKHYFKSKYVSLELVVNWKPALKRVTICSINKQKIVAGRVELLWTIYITKAYCSQLENVNNLKKSNANIKPQEKWD